MNLPTFADLRTIPDPMEALHDARTARREAAAVRYAARKRRQRAALPSVVGYMRTVQADRRDYALMLSYARASARVNAKFATCLIDAESHLETAVSTPT